MKKQTTIEHPKTYSDGYDADAIAMLHTIVDWLNANDKNITWLTKLDGSKDGRARYSQLLTGKYPSKVKMHLGKILNQIKHYEDRASATETPFFPEATVAKLTTHACRLARKRKMFALVVADVGTGKTRSLREYTKSNADTIYIDAIPMMSSSGFLEKVMEARNIVLPKGFSSREKKFSACVDHLSGTNALIILDEAETVSEKTLHMIRRLRDHAEIGVVLAGTLELDSLIQIKHGQFDQIRSRVTYATKIIKQITDRDAQSILQLAFDDQEINDETYNAIRYYSKGSVRMLVDHIIPNIREFGVGKSGQKIDPTMVHDICKKMLNVA